MKIKFENVLDGVAKFIDDNIYSGMNDWQEIIARLAVGRIFNNRENLKSLLINNPIIRTFGIIDEDGNVDVQSLTADLKHEIERKGKLTVSVPLFGNITFKPEDVDNLYNTIIGGEKLDSK